MNAFIVNSLMRKLSKAHFDLSTNQTSTKEDVLNSVKHILDEYNRYASPRYKVDTKEYK